jgi:hypothetical protein
VWESGKVPVSWKQAKLVALHKKGDPALPDNYRGITLLDVSGKVFVTVLHQRIRQHLCNQLLDCQYGFRPGKGTGGAMFNMRRLVEVAREWGAPLHAAFVDFRKAFDSVNRDTLWCLLAARGVAPKLVALAKELYTGNQACTSVGGTTSDWFDMRTGVRQGCPMSPTLFNVFIDFLARQVTQRCQQQGVQGFRVAFRAGGQLVPGPLPSDQVLPILMLLYADDMVLMADSAAALTTALQVLESVATEWGMQLNYSKTKAMVFGAATPAQGWPDIQLAKGQVGHVSEFSYLGCITTATGQQDSEIDARIRKAGTAFHRLKPHVFTALGVSQATKLRIYETCVLPILLYGAAETWALTEAQWRRVNVFHTSCLRLITKHHRRGPDMISNAQLFADTQQTEISTLVGMHSLRWLGHAVRMPEHDMARQLLFATAPPLSGGVGTRRRIMGGPQTTWNRAVLNKLQKLGLDKDWHEACLDRHAWRGIVTDRTTVGLTANGM